MSFGSEFPCTLRKFRRPKLRDQLPQQPAPPF
jgi:hypothetical protein